MADIRSMPTDNISDAALVQRLFELARNGRFEDRELVYVDSLVYGRLAEAYDEPSPVPPTPDRMAA